MEVSQAIWLTGFFGSALLISPKRFDEIILDFYQDAGIWIVIASCVAEYLLLLTYIGVAAYDFFKNRKMMKKMNVQRRTYEFLKFDESHRDVGNRLHNTVLGRKPAAIAQQIEVKSIKKSKLDIKEERTSNFRKIGIGIPQEQHLDKEVENKKKFRKHWPGMTSARARWMNKSLKRKQIE